MQWKNISYILALGTTLLCLWSTVGPSAPTAPMAQARRAPSRDILFPVRSAVPPARTLEQAFPGRLRGGDSSVPETSSSSKCRITFIQPHIVVDDQGYVCARNSRSATSNGCCPAGSDRHTCGVCEKNGCCREYEHCVSCCMSPGEKPKKGRGTTVWDKCRDQCRTSATSIAGGNRYRSDFRHCHGHAGGGSSSGNSCVKWRQTGLCGQGSREPHNDRDCDVTIPDGDSGYCECGHGHVQFGCKHKPHQCEQVCA